jgi:hypothetical protein
LRKAALLTFPYARGAVIQWAFSRPWKHHRFRRGKGLPKGAISQDHRSEDILGPSETRAPLLVHCASSRRPSFPVYRCTKSRYLRREAKTAIFYTVQTTMFGFSIISRLAMLCQCTNPIHETCSHCCGMQIMFLAIRLQDFLLVSLLDQHRHTTCAKSPDQYPSQSARQVTSPCGA